MSKTNTPKRKNGAIVALTTGLNITPSHVHKLLKLGMPDTVPEAQAWRSARAAGDDSAQTLRRERILLVREQREKIAVENQLRAGELIDLNEFGKTLFRVTFEAKMGFMKLSNDLPPRLEGQTAATICKIMRAEIIAVLRDLSDGFMKAYPDCESNLDKP
jgi:hypothetical protein